MVGSPTRSSSTTTRSPPVTPIPIRTPPRTAELEARPSAAPGLMFGVGLGGFVDGIVLHQVLQWHHMVTGERSVTTVAGLEVNTMADGFFHVGTWLVVLGASIVTVAVWYRKSGG